MGQQQSKDEILFQQVNYANIEGIKALRNEGAGLEWIDREGKTPLIVACMNPELINVAKTLIELGADVNAYRPGSHAGTPLHHAAKRGLDQTVKLLLSHGANVFVVNDDCDTPLDVARAKGFSNVVRTIESHICLFSGWLRELHGPGFLEALASQWLSRKIWVVVIPCGSRDYMKPAKLDLAIYSSPQDARPSVVIALPKAKVEEPKFHQPDPVLVLIDKATKKYKFASANEGDKQQLKGFLDACRGIPQVRHPPPPDNVAPQVVSATAPSATTEDVDLAMALSASIQSAHSNLSSGSSNTAGWGNSTDNPGNNGWGSSVAVSSPVPPSKASSSGWIDKPPKDSYNGWGASSSVAGSSPLPPSKASSTGWLDKPPENSHNGWGESSSPTGSSHLPPSKANSSGWLDKPPEDSQNGWSASEGGSSSSSKPISENLPSVVPMSTEIPETIPSAPPISEGADDGPIHYPSIDISPIDVPTKYSTENKPAITGAGKEEVVDSASCVICLDAPVEGACIPCGHMAGCMSCLNGIKAKKWGCPVCRAEINQIVRIYAV